MHDKIKNERKSIEFIQGLEKFIDSLRGKEYSAIIIAENMAAPVHVSQF